MEQKLAFGAEQYIGQQKATADHEKQLRASIAGVQGDLDFLKQEYDGTSLALVGKTHELELALLRVRELEDECARLRANADQLSKAQVYDLSEIERLQDELVSAEEMGESLRASNLRLQNRLQQESTLRETETEELARRLQDEEQRRLEMEQDAESRARAKLEDELDNRVQDMIKRLAPHMRLVRLAHGLYKTLDGKKMAIRIVGEQIMGRLWQMLRQGK